MLTENLTEYMSKVTITNKDISEYVNEENGTRYIIPTGHLLAKVDYLELTEKELEQAIDEIKHPDFPNLDEYVTENELVQAIDNIDIPSIDGLASELYVDEAIKNIDIPQQDLTGYATEEYVDNAIGNIEFPDYESVDLTGYAKEVYVDEKIGDINSILATLSNGGAE